MEIEARRAARGSAARCAAVVIILILAYCFLPLRGDDWWIGALVGTAALVSVVPLAFRRLRKLLASDQPLLELIEALVLLVTMLVMGFAAVYFAMNRNGDQFTDLDDRIDAVYFTVTTLGTVGFGDVAATSRAARLVVTLQILFDLAFIGLVVRVLGTVAQHRSQSRGTER